MTKIIRRVQFRVKNNEGQKNCLISYTIEWDKFMIIMKRIKPKYIVSH